MTKAENNLNILMATLSALAFVMALFVQTIGIYGLVNYGYSSFFFGVFAIATICTIGTGLILAYYVNELNK